MVHILRKAQHFFAELKRRNVYRVAATYAVVAFVVIQVADLTFTRLGMPPWTVTFIIVLSALGFPLALVVAWAFEMTPEGMRRTPDLDGRSEAGRAGRAGSRDHERAGRAGSEDRRRPGKGEGQRRPAEARPAPGGSDDRDRSGTVRVETPAPGTCEMIPARLEVVVGDPEVEEVRFFDPGRDAKPEFTFGRRSDPSITHVRLANPTVSREHARITFGDGGAIIENRSTTNPTRVNGSPLDEHGTTAELADGDLIDMGELRFRYREH